MHRFIVSFIWVIYVSFAVLFGQHSNTGGKVLLFIGAFYLIKPSSKLLRSVGLSADVEDDEPHPVMQTQNFNSEEAECAAEQQTEHERRQAHIRERREQKVIEEELYQAERLSLEPPLLDRSALIATRPLGTKRRGYLNTIPGMWYYGDQGVNIVRNHGACVDGQWKATAEATLIRAPEPPPMWM